MSDAAAAKEQLLADLRETGERVEATLRALPVDAFERGAYENGWNARQILAHMASMEWTYPRLLDVARAASQPAPAAPAEASSAKPARVERAPGAGASSGTPMDSYNDRQVARRADASISDLLDEFAKNRAALIAAIESADDALFDAQITSAGGARGPMSGVLRYVAIEHVTGHLRDITGESA